MKILILGCNGQLGRDMMVMCQEKGIESYGYDFPNIDITERQSIELVVKNVRPSTIINCVAYTAVDVAETDINRAFAVNAVGVANLASVASMLDIPVVHFSTDYVFSGTSVRPYVESDKPEPCSVYGKSKLAGELELSSRCSKYYIMRIAWLYGIHGSNFVKTIRAVAMKKKEAKKPLLVVNDQIGTPTWTRNVCQQVLTLLPTDRFGLYHSTSEGSCSWYDFACSIVEAFGIKVCVEPCTTAQFPRPAPRPAYSVLENRALKAYDLNVMPQWQDGFEAFIHEYSGFYS